LIVDVGLDHLVELRRVDVDVDELGVAAKHVRLADDAVVKAGADIEDEVGLADGLVRIGGAVHAEHAERKRVRFGEDAFAQQGGGDRAAEGLGQHEQFLVGTGDHGPLTGEDHGALGLGNEAAASLIPSLIDFEVLLGVVAGQVHRLVKGAGEGALADVLRDVDEHRTGAARGGDVVGLRAMRGRRSSSSPGSCASRPGVMLKMSASWKASFPSIQVTCWPQRTIIGTLSIWAVMMPVTVLPAPGPEVTRTTAGLPVARA
jgi:hypothetical protein